MKKEYKWFIVIGLSLIALTKGVWVAIGVFVLGSILALIIKSK